jgi:hypothetical protein
MATEYLDGGFLSRVAVAPEELAAGHVTPANSSVQTRSPKGGTGSGKIVALAEGIFAWHGGAVTAIADPDGYEVVYSRIGRSPPLSEDHVAVLWMRLGVAFGDEVLDLGYGSGELLLRAIANLPAARGTGVDSDPGRDPWMGTQFAGAKGSLFSGSRASTRARPAI